MNFGHLLRYSRAILVQGERSSVQLPTKLLKKLLDLCVDKCTSSTSPSPVQRFSWHFFKAKIHKSGHITLDVNFSGINRLVLHADI
jgi:hypothetical protein